MTPQQRAAIRPNEVGVVPILMYHMVIDAPSTGDGYTRTVADFRADLQRLYDQGYYVVPLRDIFLDRISAPAGKHPVALTFDDATAGQFRYLVAADGSVSIDPKSAVGILQDFYGSHPDFGRGGFFAVPPKTCFDWQPTVAEPGQTPYCTQKLRWLLDHGYEIGDHTVNHADLLDLDDDAFAAEVGGGWVRLQKLVPEIQPIILAMPYGNYPDPNKHPKQRTWLRDGFTYDGTQIHFLGALMVGANPAPSPSSPDWDPLFVPRIRAYDGDYGSTQWLATLANDPSQLYTSDGDPDTISLPASRAASLDRARTDAKGKRIVEYDPVTGAVQ